MVVDPVPLDGDVLDGAGLVVAGVWLVFVSVDVPVLDVPMLVPLLEDVPVPVFVPMLPGWLPVIPLPEVP